MNTMTVLSPYFGDKFPLTFPLLVASMKNNPEIRFVIPTNIDYSDLPVADNIEFVKTTLRKVSMRIDKVLGYHGRLKDPYKLCDYRPLYGLIFKDFIKTAWWGYVDPDVILGDVSSFLTRDVLDQYDRVFTHGQFTLFRNTDEINQLWKVNFHLREVPSFKTVAHSDAIFAFDEWGWGENKGRGFSYALNKANLIRQFADNEWIADVRTDQFQFHTVTGDDVRYFEYDHGNLKAILFNNVQRPYMYVHLQKRRIVVTNLNGYEHYFVFPNRASSEFTERYSDLDKQDWIQDQKRNRFHRLQKLIDFSYICRRLRFIRTEK